LGVVVDTFVHTPRRCGDPFRAGDLVLDLFDSRPLRTSCAMVGTQTSWVDCFGLAPRPRGAQSQRAMIKEQEKPCKRSWCRRTVAV
jgi:hypothetical protein